MKHNILRGLFLDGGGCKKTGFSLEKPLSERSGMVCIYREVWYWNLYTSCGDNKSGGKNHPDSVDIPLVGTSICFPAMCCAERGREAFSRPVPPNMHMNTYTHTHAHSDTLCFSLCPKESAGAFKCLCSTVIAS